MGYSSSGAEMAPAGLDFEAFGRAFGRPVARRDVVDELRWRAGRRKVQLGAAVERSAMRREAAVYERLDDPLQRAQALRQRLRDRSGWDDRVVESSAPAVVRRSRLTTAERYEVLQNLSRGQSSPAGCPPCGRCEYVICRCLEMSDAWICA